MLRLSRNLAEGKSVLGISSAAVCYQGGRPLCLLGCSRQTTKLGQAQHARKSQIRTMLRIAGLGGCRVGRLILCYLLSLLLAYADQGIVLVGIHNTAALVSIVTQTESLLGAL